MEKRLIDITRTLDAETAPWPGDQPFALQWTERIETGGLVNLAWFKMSPHLGTHADAPHHIETTGATALDFNLSHFVGPAWVVDVTPLEGGRIPASVLDSIDLARAPRILLRTGTHPDRKAWSPNFASLSLKLAEHLVRARVQLVGIDTPGVDPAESTDLAVHHALRSGGITWLEGLDLAAAAPGLYDLIALPLKLAGADASPVRAILIERPGGAGGSTVGR